MPDENYCANCSNLYMPDGERTPWFAWLCIAAAIPPRANYVTGKQEAPYKLCRDLRKIYGPDCPMFEAGINRLNPRPTPED